MRMMNNLTHRWTLVAAVALSTHVLAVGAALAEEDHLLGYTIKDLNQIAPLANPYTLTNLFGSETCDLRKPQFFLEQSAKNGGDDPLGGPAGHFVCYKAKCTATALPPITTAESQFGGHALEPKKEKLVCLPVDPAICGDGQLDEAEQCDGSQLGACTLGCNPDCTCFLPACEATTGGFCWFITLDTPSSGSTNCNTRCAQVGRVYDSATESFAGSGGTDANCQSVLDDLGVGSGAVIPLAVGGAGCFQSFSFGAPRVRSTDPTTATAFPPLPGGRRACACQ